MHKHFLNDDAIATCTAGEAAGQGAVSRDWTNALQVQSMDYSCVVFDTAPTGHTLRLLQLPAMMDKALGKLVGMRGMLGGVLNQVTALYCKAAGV
jgi:Anion-transporting ATPase